MKRQTLPLALTALATVSSSLCAAVTPRTTGSGGFAALCDDWQLGASSTDVIIMGSCAQNNSMPVQWSEADVGPCYNNMQGVLVPADGGTGTFLASCRDCARANTTTFMVCTCFATPGGAEMPVLAEIDLDLHMTLSDGVLGCPGNQGWVE